MKKWCANLHTIFFILQWYANLLNGELNECNENY